MRAEPLHYGKFTIHDDHALGRFINMQGGVHLFLQHRRGADRARPGRRGAQGVPAQDGPVDRLRTELPESAAPIVPRNAGAS